MSKKLKNLKWSTVPLEGFPASVTENLQGFVGLEECKTYGLDKESKRPKKKKAQKRKNKSSPVENPIPTKKVKLSNGFIVEACNNTTPSLTNEHTIDKKQNKNTKNDRKQTKTGVIVSKVNNKKHKPKLGEVTEEAASTLTPEDMFSWAEFKLPDPILKALAELGFDKPTQIQQLTLPAAIHGRRDILGAAETGSGKTLAFGLPILTGILSLKAKAEAKGLDVYEIPYKKPTIKNKKELKTTEFAKNKGKIKGKIEVSKAKESSEEGYASGDEGSSEDDEETHANTSETANKSKQRKLKKVKSKMTQAKSKTKSDDDDYLEEIEVPVRKRKQSEEEASESDGSDENYVHLSDMLDSDDLADTSDEDNSDDEVNSNQSDEIDQELDSTEDMSDEKQGISSDDEEIDNEGDEEVEEVEAKMVDEKGIGCVKVIDNVEIPHHVSTKTGKPLYALILTPTRELAIQISRHLMAAAKYTGIKIATIVGGMASVKQERVLQSGPEIVVATPGRLWQLIVEGQPHLQQLDCVKFLAIDETDRMIERGHFEELQPLLERLNIDEDKRDTRQNFVFSATLTMVHDLPSHMRGKKVTKRGKIINRKIEKMTPQQKIKRLVKMIGMSDPKVVDITTKNLGTAETLTESRIACSLEHKDAYLYYVLKRHPGRTIVFCNSIGSVRRLAQLLTVLQCRPLPLHASMQQRQRLKNLERFRDDPHGVLIATDVAARGLDIPNVDHVIHYQVPRTAENYVHRSGRTARASKEGLTILMMEPSEAYLYSKLCHTLNRTSEVPLFPVSPQLLSPLRELVSIARDIDALELKRRRATQAENWRDKVAREMDIIVDDDVVPMKSVDPSIDKAIKAKKNQLKAMLSRPLFPRGFSFKYPTLNDPTALSQPDENALQVMKKALQSGELKKEKRKSKNAPLLNLEKSFKNK